MNRKDEKISQKEMMPLKVCHPMTIKHKGYIPIQYTYMYVAWYIHNFDIAGLKYKAEITP